MIRSALAIIFLMFLILSDFANAADSATKDIVPKTTYFQFAATSLVGKEEKVTLDKAGASCQSRAQLARKACFESLNPDIQKAGLIISGVSAGISGMVDSCSKFGEAMKLANTALAAFNVACSSAKVACDTACSGAKAKLDATQETISAVARVASNPDSIAASTDVGILKGATATSIIALEKECEGHTRRLTAASLSIAAVIAEGKKANKCEEDTTTVDCNLNPTNASCVANIDCSVAANSTKTVCICARAPNSAGCAGAGLEGGGDYSQSMAATADAAEKMGNMNPSGSYSGDLISPNGGGSAAGGAMGAGGSGSGGGGVAGGSAAKGNGKSADGKALNTNILSGYEGGGGGGGRLGSGSSSSDLDQYLPGGKKDPSRNVASQVFANGQVTGGGGKSNWEKVKDRYRDNRPKLMTGP